MTGNPLELFRKIFGAVGAIFGALSVLLWPLNEGVRCTTDQLTLARPKNLLYPLARNQYINNSPEIFSCIRPGVNTCAACICTEINSPRIFLCIGTRDVRIQALYQYRGQGQSANTYFKNNSSKIFSCIRTNANTGPTCIIQEFCSCMYRFCAGGYSAKGHQAVLVATRGSRVHQLLTTLPSDLDGVAPANQTKERPVHELFAGAFRNKSSRCESCLFS